MGKEAVFYKGIKLYIKETGCNNMNRYKGIQHKGARHMPKRQWKGDYTGIGAALFLRSYIMMTVLFLIFMASPALAKGIPGGTTKASDSKELKLPYAFYNDAFGAAVGFVYGSTGYPQPQATTLGTVIAGSNSAVAFYLLSRDIRVPYTERFFFDTDLAVSHFGTIQSYINGNPDFPDERAGSNGSDKDNFVEGSGDDNLVRVTFKYLLPMGGGRDLPMNPPVLDRGLPKKGAGGGYPWNPFVSGRTFLEVKPYWRVQTIDSDNGTFDQKTNGIAFSVYRDNTDFTRNPSQGSAVRARYTRDWGWADSSRPYEVGDVEISKYISLGSSDKFRQRVLALDFWTAEAFSWDNTSRQDGKLVFNRPPAYLGATLGGLWRMRGYPTSRFNDQAAVYYALEYRLIPEWNPFAHVDWMQRYLGIEWWQWVTFVEAGRVAPAWSVCELHSAMKYDAGIGVRAMAKGIVVRVDMAGSKEGMGVSMMVGQPFQF